MMISMSDSKLSSADPERGWLSALLLFLLLLLPPAAGWAAEAPILLHFQGNRQLDEARLRTAAAEELADFARLGRRQVEIDDAAYQMQLAYRRAGYYFAEVDYQLESDQQATRVRFLINEGPLVQADSIIIQGNSAFSDRELIATVVKSLRDGPGPAPPPFVESGLRRALGLIRELYLQAGYRDAVISSDPLRFGPQGLSAEELYETLPGGEPPSLLGVEISLTVEEGLRRIIGGVRLNDGNLEQGAPPPTAVSEALAGAKAELVGHPYFTRRKLLLRSRLLEAYQQLGYPEAQVVVDELAGATPEEIILLAKVKSGPLVEIGAIEVSGQQRTSANFIRRRLTLAPGAIYHESARRDSFRELYRTGLFTRVDIGITPGAAGAEESGEMADRRTLLVAVEEGLAREYFLEGGWGSYEMLRGRVGYIDRNIFGAGRVFRLEGGGSLKGAEIKTGITDPWLLESRVSAELPLYYRLRQEPSFTRREIGIALLFSRQLPYNLNASLGYQIRRSDIDKIVADAGLESLESGYGIASLKLQLSHDTRNDIFFPSAGRRLFAAVEVAEKRLGSELNFYRFNAGWRHFRALSEHLVLGLRADSGLILPGENQSFIPLGERFYSGGENSVRSFREGRLGPKDLAGQPVGGMAFTLLNIELRRRLGNNLAISLFADYGNIAPNQSRVEEGKSTAADRSELISATLGDYFKDFRPALGFGIQYLLPVGPARLDFAFNPARRPESHEPDFVIHFSLGMAF